MTLAARLHALASTAELISKEAELTAKLARVTGGNFTPEQYALMRCTFVGGIEQLLHCQRALQLEVIDGEILAAVGNATAANNLPA